MPRSARLAVSSFLRGPWLQRGAWAALDQGGFAGANFVVNVLLARWLVPEGYGAYTVAYSVFLLVGVIHSGVLTEPMLVFGSGRFARRFETYLRLVLSSHGRFSLVSGVLVGACAIAAWISGQTVLGNALAAFALSQAAILFQWMMRAACYAKTRPEVAGASGLIYVILTVGGVAALQVAGWLNEATGVGLMGVASLVAGLYMASRLDVPWRRARDVAFAREATDRHRQYGGWAVGTGLFEWFSGYLPFLLLPLWAGLDETGALRALYNLVFPLLFLFRGMGTLLVPGFAEAHAAGTGRRMLRIVGIGVGVFTTVFGVAVLLAGPAVLHLLYDGQYDAYADLVWILAVLPFPAAVTSIAQAVLRTQERPEGIFAARAAASSVVATLGAVAVFVLGVFGALFSDLMAATAEGITMVWLLRRGRPPVITSGGHAMGRGDDLSRKHVLVVSCACGPGLGSEPGQGWKVASRLAAHHDVTAVAYSGWKASIDAELAVRPVPGLRVAYYHLPLEGEQYHTLARARTGFSEQIHYILWTLGASGFVRRLDDAHPFDAAVHASFARYWSPSPAGALVGVPFVWGPVGGGESAPRAFLAPWPWKNRLRERLRETVRAASHWLPAVRTTARRATVPLATTSESAVRMTRLGAQRVEVARASVALEAAEVQRLGALPPPPDGPLVFLFTGRLVDWKGVDMGIRAFARACTEAPDAMAGARFVVLGDGPERASLEALSERLEARVEFRGNVPRAEALATLAEAHVQVHPSLHDSGGYATLEALAAGRPVVCLDLGGPAVQVAPGADGTEVGIAVPAHTPEQAATDLAAAFVRLARDPALRAQMGAAARRRVAERFVWEDVTADLAARLDALLAAPSPITEAEPTDVGVADEILA